MHSDRPIRILAALHLACAAGIVLFWIGFHTELLFPTDVLAPRIHNFAGYYAWERSFTIPDAVTAAIMSWGGLAILRDPVHRLGRTLLIAASGALVFLGLLDFVYDLTNGMYALGHWFSLILIVVAITFIPLGVVTIWYLHTHPVVR